MNTIDLWIRRNAVRLPILVMLSVTGVATAQDRITIRDQRTGKITQFEARVIAWDASRLVYSGNDRESTIPSSRVVEISYARTATHLEADRLFESGKFLQAHQSYENAIADEPRDWVKVEMLARQLRCAKALNRQADALKAFVAIQRATPKSRYYHLIPVAWGKTRSDGSMAGLYNDWITSADESQKLIAASWLLMTDQESAIAPLKDLTRSVDSRIAHLAIAQLWRIQTLSAKPADLKRWVAAIDRMPENLQAGARFQLALAIKQSIRDSSKKMYNQAAVAMMQIPILFPEQYQLAGEALNQANEILIASGRNEEAAIVMAELKRSYALSNAAISLGTRIENLDQ